MLNFGKVPPLRLHLAHLTVQIFAVTKPVVCESEVLARNENIWEPFWFLSTHIIQTHRQTCGLQEGIKAVRVCIMDSN